MISFSFSLRALVRIVRKEIFPPNPAKRMTDANCYCTPGIIDARSIFTICDGAIFFCFLPAEVEVL